MGDLAKEVVFSVAQYCSVGDVNFQLTIYLVQNTGKYGRSKTNQAKNRIVTRKNRYPML